MLKTATASKTNSVPTDNTVTSINTSAKTQNDDTFSESVRMGQFVDVEVGRIQQSRFKSFLIGVKENKYLILEQPDSKRYGFVRDILVEGQAIVIRTICEKTTGECIAFNALVEGILNHPKKLLFISYPKDIQKRELRSERRNTLRFPAKISLANQTNHIVGEITDISDGGCRVEITVDEKVKGIKQDFIFIEFEHPQTGIVQNVYSKVCSQRKEMNILSIGAAFNEPLQVQD